MGLMLFNLFGNQIGTVCIACSRIRFIQAHLAGQGLQPSGQCDPIRGWLTQNVLTWVTCLENGLEKRKKIQNHRWKKSATLNSKLPWYKEEESVQSRVTNDDECWLSGSALWQRLIYTLDKAPDQHRETNPPSTLTLTPTEQFTVAFSVKCMSLDRGSNLSTSREPLENPP